MQGAALSIYVGSTVGRTPQ